MNETIDTVEESAGAEASAAKARQAPGSSAAPAPSRKTGDPALARAFRTGRPVRGTVEGVIKGGFEVRLHQHRGFCPFSQMDVSRVDAPEEFVGQTIDFRVIQYRRGGDDVVVSRRALLEEERQDEAKAVRATLIRGSVMRGHVVSLTHFGAFVDLGAGVTGLVHTSELAHHRVREPAEAVAIGQPVDVKILKLDEARGRISLSIRQAQPDPWDGISERIRPGETYPGTVARIEEFGAFVELEPGVEGRLHPRDLPPREGGWGNEFEPGQRRDWRVRSVDSRRRRISLLPAEVEVGEGPAELVEGSTVEGRVLRAERFGVLVWLGPGKTGLIPAALTGTPKGTNLSDKFPEGRALEVDVLEIAEGGRRIRLAVHGVAAESPPRRSRRREDDEIPSAPRETTQFRNDLGDLLKAALDSSGASDDDA